MPTLEINGRKVQVGDEFLQLSPEEQDATVDEIAQGMEPQEKSVGGFIQNIGEDAYNTGEAIAGGIYAGGKKLVTDPVGAAKDVFNAGDTAGAVISGGLGHAYNAAVPESMEMTPGHDMNLASKVGDHLKDRYWDNLGDTLYEHPVQSAMDVSSLAYGGQAALPRAMVGAKQALGAVAGATNPLNVVAKPVNALRGAMAEKSVLKKMRKEAPSHDQVIAMKNARYDALDNAGIKFDANNYGQMMQSIAGKLKTFRERRAPMTRDLAENVMMPFYGKSPSFRDVEEMLIEAKSILRIPDNAGPHVPTDKAAARIVLDEVSQFFDNAPLMTNGSVPANQVAAMAKEARDLARRHIIAREMGEIERKKEWYTSGDESGTRNQFASFGKRQGKSLTPVEARAAKKVVRREGVHGLLNTGGTKLAQTLLLGSLGFGMGLPAALAGGGLSVLSRAASAGMTNAKAKQFRQTVLAGREAQAAAMQKAKRLPVNTKTPLLSAEIARLLQERQ